MNPNSKKVLAAAAVAGVLVTWIHQLVSAGDDAPKPTTLGPALEQDDATTTDSTSVSVVEGSGSVPGPEPIADTTDPAETLRIRLGAARAFLPERSSRDLDVLAAAWALDARVAESTAISGPPASMPVTTPDATSVAGAPTAVATQRAEPPSVDALDVFLATNPLTGILYSEDLRVANLGANVVREGDDVSGIARVEAIGPRWIVLESGARHVRVDLVPLTARAKAQVYSVGSVGPASAVVAGSPTPASSASPAGASSASAPPAVDLEKLLLGLQQQLGAAAGTSAKAATTDAKSKDKKP